MSELSMSEFKGLLILKDVDLSHNKLFKIIGFEYVSINYDYYFFFGYCQYRARNVLI